MNHGEVEDFAKVSEEATSWQEYINYLNIHHVTLDQRILQNGFKIPAGLYLHIMKRFTYIYPLFVM